MNTYTVSYNANGGSGAPSGQTKTYGVTLNAADNGRIHFIPVWFADGDYTVSVTASRVWTPAGIISATRTSNTINIDGSIFDDYYVGN